jgi:hypothetical protein
VRAVELSPLDEQLGPLTLVAAVALDEAEGGVVALAWSAAAEAGERDPALFAGSSSGVVWELRLRGGALEPLRRLQLAGLTHLSGAGAGGVLGAGLLAAPALWAQGRAEELPQLSGLFVSALLALPETTLGCEDGCVWGLAPDKGGGARAVCSARLGEPVAALVWAEGGILAVGRGGRVALLGHRGEAWQLLASSQLAGVRSAVRCAALAGRRRLYVVVDGGRLLRFEVGGEPPWPVQLAAHEVPLVLAAAQHGQLAVAARPVVGASSADLVVVHDGGGNVYAALVSTATPAGGHAIERRTAPAGDELEASLVRLTAAGAQEAALREVAATVAAEMQQLRVVASLAAATCSVHARARAAAPGHRAEAELVVRLRGVHAEGCTMCVSVEPGNVPLVQLGPVAAHFASRPLAALARIDAEPGHAVEALIPLELLSPLPVDVRVDVLWSHGSRTVVSTAVPVAHLISSRAESPAAALRTWLRDNTRTPRWPAASSRQPTAPALRELTLLSGSERWRAADWAVCACLRADSLRAGNDVVTASDARGLARRRRRLEPTMRRRLAAVRESIALSIDAALPECAQLYLSLRDAER